MPALSTHRKFFQQLIGHINRQVRSRHEFFAAHAALSREGKHEPIARKLILTRVVKGAVENHEDVSKWRHILSEKENVNEMKKRKEIETSDNSAHASDCHLCYRNETNKAAFNHCWQYLLRIQQPWIQNANFSRTSMYLRPCSKESTRFKSAN